MWILFYIYFYNTMIVLKLLNLTQFTMFTYIRNNVSEYSLHVAYII